MCGLGEMVQADGECLGLQVREKIDLSVVYLAQKSASIVAGAGELRLEQRRHGRFGSVADHLDGIDEVFSLGKEPGETVGFRQLRNREVTRRVLTFQLQRFQFFAQTVNALFLLTFSLLVE